MIRITKRKIAMGLLGLLAIWLLGNLGYRWVVGWRVAQHEATIDWTPQGVHPAAEPHSHGSGSTGVLLVHGINDTPEVWDRLAPELAESGVFVHAMRLPGFGGTTSQYGGFGRGQWVEAVADELKQLRDEHQDVVLVGHSLGGAVSIATAREHPDLLDALVLLSPAIAVSSDRSPLLPTRTWHQLSYYLAPFVSVTESPFDPDALDPESRKMASRTRFVPRRVVDELFLLIDENAMGREQLQSPTLFIVAAEDQVISNSAAQQYAESLDVPTEFLTLEGCAHMIQRDYKWREVSELVARWIGSNVSTALSAGTGS